MIMNKKMCRRYVMQVKIVAVRKLYYLLTNSLNVISTYNGFLFERYIFKTLP